MVGGRWRVIDGQIEGLDVAALIAAHNQAARQLIAG
jgi:8-oxoguanine deaminase